MIATNDEAVTESRSCFVHWLLSGPSDITEHLSFSHELAIPSALSNGANLTCAPAKPPRLHLTVPAAASC